MAIDLNTTGTHISAFPSNLRAGMGGAHQYDVRLSADTDNGQLIGRSDTWVAFDEFAQAPVPETNPFNGVILGKTKDGKRWYVGLKADCDALFVYNSPVSPYDAKVLQDEKLFYNKIGDTVRASELKKGDSIELSENAFTGTPVAGKAVSYATGKYVVAE